MNFKYLIIIIYLFLAKRAIQENIGEIKLFAMVPFHLPRTYKKQMFAFCGRLFQRRWNIYTSEGLVGESERFC